MKKLFKMFWTWLGMIFFNWISLNFLPYFGILILLCFLVGLPHLIWGVKRGGSAISVVLVLLYGLIALFAPKRSQNNYRIRIKNAEKTYKQFIGIMGRYYDLNRVQSHFDGVLGSVKIHFHTFILEVWIDKFKQLAMTLKEMEGLEKNNPRCQELIKTKTALEEELDFC